MDSPASGGCNRRGFLRTAALSTAALAIEPSLCESVGLTSNAATLPRREFGKTGVQLSIIGMGGIVVKDADQDHANRIVSEFVERGVNYFDVAPSYGDAEDRLGPALDPHRKDVFLACKTQKRTGAEAAGEMKRSLEKLRTDYFDLYQLHAVTDVAKDIDAVFAKGGAMEVLTEAKKSGQIRHIGFSAHSVEAAFAAMDRFDFDSILFPVNFANYFAGNFGPQIMERAQSKGMACLALKALARQKWPENDPERKVYPKCWYQPLTDRKEADLALRFTLGQPVTAALPPGDEALFRLALDLAPGVSPLTESQSRELRELAASLHPLFHAA
ncbi:MAG: aldo/keto reductase [Verrucomicrobiaceae bacterium]|nr:MAG: aldo/keto reductase [Verrucomicrobiaceae bacterium]